MKKKWLAELLIAGLLATSVPFGTAEAALLEALPAFPGAEGGGKYVTGGRAQAVYEVTTLADYGRNETPIPGSLRDAVSGSNRTIVFRVGGTIRLKESLKITGSNLTIAGQTAPGDGITVADYTTSIEADNIIMRYMRFRLGDRVVSEDDAFGSRYHKNIIIDHSSFSWSVDEVVSLYDNENTTVQWSISAESMLMTSHHKGRHGYGGIWGGKNASYHHNLIAHSTSRNPRLPTITRLVDLTEMTNNVIYNWGFASTYGGGAEGYLYNISNNYYKNGPNTYSSVKKQLFGEVAPVTKLYLAGNVMDGSPEVTADNWQGVQSYSDSSKLAEPAVMPNPYVEEPASDAYANVLAGAGATLPRRDAYDARVMNDVKNRTGQHINSPLEIGGYPDYPETASKVVDQDHDGMNDAWETARGLSPSDPADRNGTSLSSEGYTNLEVYLNDLIVQATASGEHTDNPVTAISYPTNNQILEAGSDVTLTASASDKDGIAKVEFIVNGVKQGEAATAPYRFEWKNVQDGTYYLVVQATDNKGLKTQSDNVAVHVNASGSTGPWTPADIGNPGIAGHTSVNAETGQVTVKSAGLVGATSESVKTEDNFHFAYRTLEGNGELIAKIDSVTATDDDAKAGVMIRDSLQPDAKMAMMAIPYVKYGKKGVLITRSVTGAKVVRTEPDSFITTPYWVKLVRLGDEVTGLVSPDKVAWSKVGTVNLGLKETVYMGLAADAAKADNEVNRYNISRFSGVELKTLDDKFPATPLGLTAAGGSKKVELKWEPVPFAKTYSIKRSEVSGGPYTLVSKDNTGNLYTDLDVSPGKTYYYTVIAVNEFGESFDSDEASAEPKAEAGNIYYVDEDFERVAAGTTPEYYEVSPNPQTDVQKVVVSATPSGSKGNTSAQVLNVYDSANGNVQFIRRFTPMTGALVIDTDFMFAAESGTSVFLQAQSADGSKTAFSIESRKPTLPAAAGKYTLTMSRGSSQYHQLMSAYALNQWYNLKLKVDVQGDEVEVYIDNQLAGSFPFTTTNFAGYGIGRILSKTPGGGSGNYYLDNLKVYVEPVASPLGLTGLPGNGAAQLKWPALEGAASYNVKRALTAGGPYDTVASAIAETSYVDKELTNETTYYYVITAVALSGESGNSNEISITPSASAVKLPAPEQLAAVSRNAQLELSWNAVKYAESYTVKQWNATADRYEPVAEGLTDTAYRIGGLTNGQTYRFVISAVNVAGEGGDSLPVEAQPLPALATPEVTVQAGDSAVKVNWTAVGDAQSYRVTRALSPEGPYELLAAEISGTSYDDTGLANGTPYYYKVAAAAGTRSGLASDVAGTVPFQNAGQPGIPQGVTAEPGNGEVKLSWTASAGNSSYRIIRSETGGDYRVVAEGIGEAAYTDTGLANGTAYDYAVIAVDGSGGAASLPSMAVSAVPAPVMVVDQSRAGDYKTLNEAILASPDNSTLTTIIKVKNGTYPEKVLVPAGKKNLRIIGESREGTLLVNADSAKTIGPDGKEMGTSGSYTLKVAATDFTLENMTVQNSAGRTAGQAVALYAEGDRGVYRNVKLLGYQDTLFADKGRAYFVDSHIEGTVDFIFGNAAAVFENNVIQSAGAGYVTAPSTEAGKPGYVFLNNRLTAGEGVAAASVDLGRPWRDYGSSTFINTDMGAHIKPSGWHEWYDGRSRTARFSEYMSYGEGANAAARYSWSKQLTAEEAQAITVQAVLAGSDGWNPQPPMRLLSQSQVPGAKVSSITVSGEEGRKTIETDKGVLQLQAVVLPENAANRNVHWTVTEPDGMTSTPKASIDENGLLTAKANGTVLVTAASLDGSRISGSLEVVISGQEEVASGLPSATLNGPVTVSPGQEFAYRVGIANVTDSVYRSVYSADFTLDYAAAGIEFISARSLVEGITLSPVSADHPGQLSVSAAAAEGVALTDAREYIEISFRAKETAAEISVPLKFAAFSGSNGIMNFPIKHEAQAVIRVIPKVATQINVTSAGDVSVLQTGQKLQMHAAVLPVGTNGTTVTWSVYNADGSSTVRATITETGLVTAIAAGKITVKADSGESPGVAGTMNLEIKDGNHTPQPGGNLPPTVTTGKQPQIAAGVNGIAVSLAANVNGKAAAELSAITITKAVEAVQTDTLRIEVRSPADTTAVQLTLPAQAMVQAVSGRIRTVEIDLGLSSFRLDAELIRRAAGSASSSLTFTVAKSGSEQITVQGNLGNIYELGFSVDGQPVKQFDGGLKVSLNYDRPAAAAAEKIVIYHILDKGQAEVIRNSKYNLLTGKVDFSPAHFSKYAAGYAESTFGDIAGLEWAKSSIEALAVRGILEGTDTHTFGPGLKVTRAEFLKMLMLALDLDNSEAASTFTDAAPEDWYYSSVAAAQQLGIVLGRPDGTFSADAPITREEMALLAFRAARQAYLPLQGSGQTAAYKDASNISGYAMAAVQAMSGAGIIQGVGNNSYAPKAQASRAQAAVIVQHLFLLRP
ncbi:pectinesterase family protein [Paenibacillus sp. FSL M7-1046]|uniref:pectinesterase family protein n=1 Tax=Paenibacillus sp. FSL M7-1046 TaxID=2975315 RepID=UPI0030FA8B48